MACYALLLQRQNRGEEAIEQYLLAAELFQSRGQQEPALECIERVAQLDPENPDRHRDVGQLAERLGKKTVASRALLRAGQLLEASGEAVPGLELLARGHRLVPEDRGPALVYAQTLLRRGQAAQADWEHPGALFLPASSMPLFLTTLGDAQAMESGNLDRARTMFERLPAERPGTTTAEALRAGQTVSSTPGAGWPTAVALLKRIQQFMAAARQESNFAEQLDALVADYPHSLPLAEFWAALYAQLNRETKYFDALARLFDLYLEAGNVQGAADALDKLIDIDPYDSRNHERVAKVEGRADPEFLTRLHARLSHVATHVRRMQTAALRAESGSSPALSRPLHDRGQQRTRRVHRAGRNLHSVRPAGQSRRTAAENCPDVSRRGRTQRASAQAAASSPTGFLPTPSMRSLPAPLLPTV